jgi:hypothetical protein
MGGEVDELAGGPAGATDPAANGRCEPDSASCSKNRKRIQ